MIRKYSGTLLILGFTAILVGYLSVWLPGPGAGLSFLGIEMGEWFKFTGLGPRRDIFYLPPITLGLMLAIWTLTWPEGGWRAWAMRLVAILISLLAFPAYEDITGAVREQYTLRAALTGLVIFVAILSGFWRPGRKTVWVPWLLLVLLGLVGLVLPSWLYMTIRPFINQIFGLPVGIGLGVWLNGVGYLLVTAVSLIKLVDSITIILPKAA